MFARKIIQFKTDESKHCYSINILISHILKKRMLSDTHKQTKYQNTVCWGWNPVSNHKALCNVDMFEQIEVFQIICSRTSKSSQWHVNTSAKPRLPVVSLPSAAVSFGQRCEGCQVWTGSWQVLLTLLSLSFSRTRGFRDSIRSHENAVSRVTLEILAAADRTVIFTFKWRKIYSTAQASGLM